MLAYLGVSLRAAELRQHAVVDRPVRTGCDAFADGSLMMIIAARDHPPGAYLAMWEGPGEGQDQRSSGTITSPTRFTALKGDDHLLKPQGSSRPQACSRAGRLPARLVKTARGEQPFTTAEADVIITSMG